MASFSADNLPPQREGKVYLNPGVHTVTLTGIKVEEPSQKGTPCISFSFTNKQSGHIANSEKLYFKEDGDTLIGMSTEERSKSSSIISMNRVKDIITQGLGFTDTVFNSIKYSNVTQYVKDLLKLAETKIDKWEFDVKLVRQTDQAGIVTKWLRLYPFRPFICSKNEHKLVWTDEDTINNILGSKLVQAKKNSAGSNSVSSTVANEDMPM